MWQRIEENQKEKFNKLATHPLQTFEWGEFREKSGVKVIRKGLLENEKLIQAFQMTIHPIPHTPWNIGYLPKGILPTKELIDELYKIGKEEKCIFIQLEPNIILNNELGIMNNGNYEAEKFYSLIHNSKFIILASAHPLFTKHTLQINLTKSEEDLLKAMHQKARYNIKVAQKHDVKVEEKNTSEGFDAFWKLTEETTTRQQFFAHTKKYHKTQWETLPHVIKPNTLSSHLLFAKYQDKPLTAWIVFIFKDMLYYPYGASSQEHRETMHSTLMMWEAIRFGKEHGLKKFDLWGAAAPETPESDPWFGFTQFKERFGPEKIEFVGSYDLVINPLLYQGYRVADKLRWILLKMKK